MPASVVNLPAGTRFDIDGVRLHSVNKYIGHVHQEETLKYRHVFLTEKGEKIVYTGQKLIANYTERYHLRATIKRQEPQFFATRIMRPVLTKMDPRQKALI